MKKHIIHLLLVSLLVFSSCKKYSEGGWSIQSGKNLCGNLKEEYSSKIWVLDTYEKNDIDSTKGYIVGRDAPDIITISEAPYGMKLSTPLFYYKMVFNYNSTNLLFTPILDEDTCNYECSPTMCERNIFFPESKGNEGASWVWKILKLKKNELVITSFGNNKHKIILKSDIK